MEHFLKQQQDERNAATSSSVLLSHLPASQLRGAYVISVFRLLKTASVLSAHDHYLHYAAINPANGDVYESKEFSACKLLELDAANLPCYQQNFTRCVLDVTVPTVSYRMGVSCMALTVADIGEQINDLTRCSWFWWIHFLFDIWTVPRSCRQVKELPYTILE